MSAVITPEQERRKRRRELAVALGAVFLVVAIFLVEYNITVAAEDIPVAGHLLLFGLIGVVTLLLILVFFFLIRNIFKLVFERRRQVLGSHLKTRLTVAFVALTLVPTALLFIASAGVVHTTIESWFKTRVEESLQAALVVAQAYYQSASENVLNSGTRLASIIEERSLLDRASEVDLRRTLESWLVQEGLSSIRADFADQRPTVVVMAESVKSVAIPAPRPSFLKIGFQAKKTSKVLPLDEGGDLIRGIIPIASTPSRGVPAVLVVDHYIPHSLAARLFTISSAYGDYQEARGLRGPVKTVYVLILLMVALLVLLIGFWFGMTLARDITDPIQSLAEGTGAIAAGNLDVFIEPVGDDELGTLVRSFNKMAADLRRSRDELVRINQDLDSRRAYMESVLKSVAAGVLALGPDGRITAANRSATRLLGAEAREMVGHPPSYALPEPAAAAVNELLEELADSSSEAIERQLTVSFPQKVLSLLCFANSLRDEEGRDLGVVLVFEDMTHLVKAQRMVAWREVARRIAHEIKNPLTPIQLNAQRIRRKYMDLLEGDSAVLDRCTATIIDQVEQLKAMVNEFSRFARMPAANPVPADLNGVAQEVVELFANGNERVRFAFHPDPAVPTVHIDREQMKRALVNLVGNAAAAVGDGGTVDVTTRYAGDLSMVAIEVADNGPGIGPLERDRIFEPYFSTKAAGTGLGLTIVSAIVSDHNGFVRVQDNPTGGAIFVVELPVRSASDRDSSHHG